MSNEETTLVELARARFPDLSEAEHQFLEATEAGNLANFRVADDEQDDPANAAMWGHKRVLRAVIINWLCLQKSARDLVTDRGIQVAGARIDGAIDITSADFGRPIVFLLCSISHTLSCQFARLKFLSLQGSRTSKIYADGLHVVGGVFLRRGFESDGEVRLLGAYVGGNLDCSGGRFRCSSTESENDALSADGVRVSGSVFFRDGFEANGGVRLVGASVGSSLDCSGGKFFNARDHDDDDAADHALIADGIQVSGEVSLSDGFEADGEVRLLRASIGCDLNCVGGMFRNPEGRALNADGLRVNGNVFLRGNCQVEGRVSLVSARTRHFQFRDFKTPDSVYLDLRHATLETFWIDDASLPSRDRCWLHGLVYESLDDSMHIESAWWIDFIERQTTESPESKQLLEEAVELDGLNVGQEAERRRRQAQAKRVFLPQPYEQAAKVLRAHGHADAAKEILIAKEKARTRTIPFWSLPRLWHGITGCVIGYGYRPGRAFLFSVAIVVLGTVLFHLGDCFELMLPFRDSGPAFVPCIYSLETFTPLIKLKQADHWYPDMRSPWGFALAWYGYLHTIAGWVLTTLLVAALTGLMRRT